MKNIKKCITTSLCMITLFGVYNSEAIANATPKTKVTTKTKVIAPVVANFKISLNKNTVNVGESLKLKTNLTLKTGKLKDAKIKFYTSNNSIATIDGNGLIKTYRDGVVKIKAVCLKQESYVILTVNPIVNNISISLSKETINFGEKNNAIVNVKMNPENASQPQIKYSTSDNNIATIDQSGNITTIKDGEVYINAGVGDKQSKVKLTIKPVVKGITLKADNDKIYEGNTQKIQTVIDTEPQGSNNIDKVQFKSSDESIATVDNDGNVKAIKSGKVKIVAAIGGEFSNIDFEILPKGTIEINNVDEYKATLKTAIENFDDKLTLDIKNYDNNIYNLDTIDNIVNTNPTMDYGYRSSANSSNYYEGDTNRVVNYSFKYDFSKDEMLKMKNDTENKAKEIINSIIKPEMNELQKEIAIHDYIINNARYDEEVDTKGIDGVSKVSFTPYGVLVKGVGVCESYAKAMCLLSKMAGIECLYVTGQGNGGPHAWNIIKIDGDYYQLDLTFDDPVMKDGTQTLSHSYFNVTDDVMAKDHTWDRTKYPSCTATKDKYSNLDIQERDSNGNIIPVAKSADEFYNMLKDAVNNRRTNVYIKVNDYTNSGAYKNVINKIYNECNVGYSYEIKSGDMDSVYISIKFEY